MRAAGRILAVLLAAVPGQLRAGPADPLVLIDAMSRGFRELNYRGLFTYEQGQELMSARIVHAVHDGVERERLEQLDGSRREFLRIDHPVDCLHAGRRLLQLGSGPRALAEGPQTSAAALANYYAFEFEGDERVASRDGRRLRVSPRDAYRYGMMLVLDERSALLLKAETTDAAGRVLERFQFVDVEIGGAIAGTELSGQGSASRIDVTHDHAAADTPPPFGWSVAWLPDGFALSQRELRRAPASRAPVEAQMYTDGLAAFGVFVERGVHDLPAPGEASQGATVAYVIPRGGDNLVTVVGEIPVATAQLIANSVNFAATGP
jgi:sigma-E factor negative regulatory protein RseB